MHTEALFSHREEYSFSICLKITGIEDHHVKHNKVGLPKKSVPRLIAFICGVWGQDMSQGSRLDNVEGEEDSWR